MTWQTSCRMIECLQRQSRVRRFAPSAMAPICQTKHLRINTLDGTTSVSSDDSELLAFSAVGSLVACEVSSCAPSDSNITVIGGEATKHTGRMLVLSSLMA